METSLFVETRAYATAKGIKGYLTSLEGLHRLIRDRRAAHIRGEMLPAFVVERRYLLLRNGDIARLTGLAAQAKNAPPVVSMEEFHLEGQRSQGDQWRMTYRQPALVAPDGEVCPECGRGWDLENCHDTAILEIPMHTPHGPPQVLSCFFHVDCHRRRVGETWFSWAEAFLTHVGMPEMEPELIDGMIPNDPTPWFRITTSAGRIHFGRMPVGYGIDWTETGRELPQLFRDANYQGHPITHEATRVLPPNVEKFVECFHRLREALSF